MTNDAAMAQALASLEPTSIIELYEVSTKTDLHGESVTYRFHPGVNEADSPGPIIWKGWTYSPWPIEASGFEYNGKGSLPRPSVKVGNVNGAISEIMMTINQFNPGNNLAGATVKRIRTLARFLDARNFAGDVNPFGTTDESLELPREIYVIDRKVAETRDFVEFELASALELGGFLLPRRQCLASICSWDYRTSRECGYNGDQYFTEDDDPTDSIEKDVCSKSIYGCQLRFGLENARLPFGGFPGVGLGFQ